MQFNSIAKRASNDSDVITQSNSDKQIVMVGDLTLFQARKQMFLKQVIKREFGVYFPPFSLRKRLCCLTLAGSQ